MNAPSLPTTLLALAVWAVVLVWLNRRIAREADRTEAVGARALDLLVTAWPRRATLYRECPGCIRLVHHTDLEEHAARCAPLQQMAARALDRPQ